MKYLNRFRVHPGDRVRLKDIDPGFKDHHESHKKAAAEIERDRETTRTRHHGSRRSRGRGGADRATARNEHHAVSQWGSGHEMYHVRLFPTPFEHATLPQGIVTDDKNVYWADMAEPAILSCPIDGCGAGGPVVLAEGDAGTGGAPFHLGLDDAAVYWSYNVPGGLIMRVAKP